MKFKNFFSILVENTILNLIHLKHFYPYLFVHKPLCDKFKLDSIQIMNVYLCRSCFYLYLGISSALILNKFLNLNWITLLAGLFIIIFFSRFFLGFLTVVFLLKAYYYDKLLFGCSIICLLIIKHLYNSQRQKVDLCKNCQELATHKICSGYILQTSAILQIEEDMSNYIMNKRWRMKND